MSNDLISFNHEEMQVIKGMFCNNATDMEFNLFIGMAKTLGLDPKKKEIYFIKYGQGDKAKCTMVVGIDGYRKIAERSGKYMPGREPTFTYKNNALFSATAYVKRLGPDKTWHEVAATAILSEYDAGQGMWKKMPHAMLAKCAESLALRRAFPSEMAGTYTEEEMEQAEVIEMKSEAKEHGRKAKEEFLRDTEIEHKSDEPMMSIAQSIELCNLAGNDRDYLNRIYKHYGATDFLGVPVKHYDMIKSKINAHNVDKEMSNA